MSIAIELLLTKKCEKSIKIKIRNYNKLLFFLQKA